MPCTSNVYSETTHGDSVVALRTWYHVATCRDIAYAFAGHNVWVYNSTLL